MQEFDSREAAVQHAIGSGLMDDDAVAEGFSVIACRGTDHCGQIDPSPEFQMSCDKCERTIIAPGGTA